MSIERRQTCMWFTRRLAVLGVCWPVYAAAGAPPCCPPRAEGPCGHTPAPQRAESPEQATPFLAAYHRLGSPRIVVAGIGWSSGPGPSGPGRDADGLARALARSVAQGLTGPGVKLISGGPGEAFATRPAPGADLTALAREIGADADADLAVLCGVEEEAGMTTASYVLVDLVRGRVLGSWPFDITADGAGVVDNRRVNEFGRQLAEEVARRLIDAADAPPAWLLVFEGLDDDGVAVVRSVLPLVRGVCDIGDLRLRASQTGLVCTVEVAFAKGAGELAARVTEELRLAELPVMTTGARPGEVKFAVDRTRLSTAESLLAGDAGDGDERAAAVRRLGRALGALSNPPIGVRLTGFENAELRDALGARLRRVGMRVVDSASLRPGDLELGVQPGSDGRATFALRFVEGELIAAAPAELTAAATADATARLAVGRLMTGLVVTADVPSSITVHVSEARSQDDVSGLVRALRGVRGVRSVCVRGMSFGAGGDRAQLWIASSLPPSEIFGQLRRRAADLPFAVEETAIHHGHIELTLKDK